MYTQSKLNRSSHDGHMAIDWGVRLWALRPFPVVSRNNISPSAMWIKVRFFFCIWWTIYINIQELKKRKTLFNYENTNWLGWQYSFCPKSVIIWYNLRCIYKVTCFNLLENVDYCTGLYYWWYLQVSLAHIPEIWGLYYLCTYLYSRYNGNFCGQLANNIGFNVRFPSHRQSRNNPSIYNTSPFCTDKILCS